MNAAAEPLRLFGNAAHLGDDPVAMPVEHVALAKCLQRRQWALPSVERRSALGSFRSRALDAELIALRIGEHGEAAAVGATVIIDERCAQSGQPLDFSVAEQIGFQVECIRFLTVLGSGTGRRRPG